MTDLLPCPFCGSKNIDPTGWASTDRAGPACDDCAGTADTVTLWNGRPGVAQAPLDREAMEKLIQRHASAYVARGAAISDSIIAECKASREALRAALSTLSSTEPRAPATIAELEAILNSEDDTSVTINPDGTVSPTLPGTERGGPDA